VEIRILQSLVYEKEEVSVGSIFKTTCENYKNFYHVEFLIKIASMLKLKFD
jgi:hypothetical protein